MVAEAERELLLHRLASVQPALRRRLRATVPREAMSRLREGMDRVTAVQLEALMLLHESPQGLPMHALAQAQSMAPSAATQMVERLVRSGWVERTRDARDRRMVCARLTGSARGRFEELLLFRMQSLSAATVSLTRGELETLVCLLEKMAQSAGATLPTVTA